jgi:hypothetical protein
MDARLKNLMPPPARPRVETSDANAWKILQRQFGVTFPSDYFELVCTYGHGCMDDFLWLPDPFSSGWLQLVMRRLQAMYESRAVQYGKTVPYALYPERGGLFPWAYTDNGDTIYWTVGEDRVVVGAARDPDWDERRTSLSTFLADLIEHKVSSNVLPDTFPGPTPVKYEAKPARP